LARRKTRAPARWIKLYNGKDLTGWHAQGGRIDVWKADGPILSTLSGGGGWLTTADEYGDFELRLEYRTTVSYTHLTLPTICSV